MASPVTPRRPIAVLAPAVAQRIAAGEVIDRPSSVLRELIENALDAGAGSIWIEIRGSGLDLISVSDDGHGIPPDELQMAFMRHGTSKLRSADDLDAVETLGFRGEALPSIAAVSTVEITSATGAEPWGARLVIADGTILEEGRVARTTGTTVRVQQLFATQPVRRGFLPSARAESVHFIALLRRYALAWPEVRLSLTLNGRAVFRTAGLGEASALAAVFGTAASRLHTFGPLDAAHARFSGHLGNPGLTRGSREGVTIIVNRRWVAPARWLAELERAYRPLLPRNRHPVAVLRATVESGYVDVNLHPSKLEIRLKDEEAALGVLCEAIRGALGRRPAESSLLVPTLGLTRQPTLPRPRRLLHEQGAEYDEQVPDFARMRLLGQSLGSMLLAEDAGALYLIDQHRADEQAIYEALTSGPSSHVAQELLEPLSLELRSRQEAAVEAALPELARLGFRCERFGRRSFLVRTVPAGLTGMAGSAFLAALDHEDFEVPGWRDRLLTAVACRSAVRRGVPLTEDEMQRVLKRLAACAIQTVCPHGSPILAQVRASDIARHFNWR